MVASCAPCKIWVKDEHWISTAEIMLTYSGGCSSFPLDGALLYVENLLCTQSDPVPDGCINQVPEDFPPALLPPK